MLISRTLNEALDIQDSFYCCKLYILNPEVHLEVGWISMFNIYVVLLYLLTSYSLTLLLAHPPTDATDGLRHGIVPPPPT